VTACEVGSFVFVKLTRPAATVAGELVRVEGGSFWVNVTETVWGAGNVTREVGPIACGRITSATGPGGVRVFIGEAGPVDDAGAPVAVPDGWRELSAKYPGTCSSCGGAIHRGAVIWHGGRGLAVHAGCDTAGLELRPAGSGSRTGGRGRRSSRYGVTSRGRGRCEDAPCCGCCD
jgi:hypothetical protein